ncbi:hypothetical protein NQ315_001454 [Exocentrus adspersus]|uniref:Uncharacterized protein n=1 Tax=Exocentrus adspersus TaxID=1586481 RepID=A0AAV8W9P9_9CUCU|nr:hypothetical protein NQ315_001454 [Exocentrus adspersus]
MSLSEPGFPHFMEYFANTSENKQSFVCYNCPEKKFMLQKQQAPSRTCLAYGSSWNLVYLYNQKF